MTEKVNHPIHYNHHPSGVEAIDIIEHMNFCLGNAFKYIFRFNLKGGLEDIDKAIWYLERQTKNPNTLRFDLPQEVFFKIEEFLAKEDDSNLKIVYNNIIQYQFYGEHPKVLWESIEILHRIEQRYK